MVEIGFGRRGVEHEALAEFIHIAQVGGAVAVDVGRAQTHQGQDDAARGHASRHRVVEAGDAGVEDDDARGVARPGEGQGCAIGHGPRFLFEVGTRRAAR